jgi:hypothetical protein
MSAQIAGTIQGSVETPSVLNRCNSSAKRLLQQVYKLLLGKERDLLNISSLSIESARRSDNRR